MAYLNTTRTDAPSLWARLATFRAELGERAAKRRLYKSTLSELNALSDRDLEDLGLHRSRIAEVARGAAYGG